MDPSKPNEPHVDQGTSIPRSRQGSDEALEGEVIPKGVPLGRPAVEQPAVSPAPAKKNRLGIGRTLLIVIASVSASLCLGGLVTGYLLYDKATTPDRGSPSVTLKQYVEVKFVNRDASRTKLFECDSPKLGSVNTLFEDVLHRERQFGVSIDVLVSDFIVDQGSEKANIKADLSLSVNAGGASQIDVQKWNFEFVFEDGWRVCEAARID